MQSSVLVHRGAPASEQCLANALTAPLRARASGESMTLSHFRDTFLKPYIMSQAAWEEECKVAYEHGAPAPAAVPEKVGGDAFQGL